MVDSGSCNACEAEYNALSNPYYDLEKPRIHFLVSPRHADVIFLNVMTMSMYYHTMDHYNQMTSPKCVIAIENY
jgi:Ni,Fe-hydrogenase III small subunit